VQGVQTHQVNFGGTDGQSFGSWLLDQLRGQHLTFLDWATLRDFERPIAKRLYALLEAERFSDGLEKRWPVDAALFVTLGMGRGNPRQPRQRLGEVAAEVQASVSRYSKVAVQPRERGRGHLPIARRRSRSGVSLTRGGPPPSRRAGGPPRARARAKT
jgi:hypothetical protein